MLNDLLKNVTGKSECQPHFEIEGKNVLSVGFPELDALHVYGYMIGEGMAMFGQSRGPLFIVNTETNKIKKLVDENSKVVGFTKEDIDYSSLKGIEHIHNKNCSYICDKDNNRIEVGAKSQISQNNQDCDSFTTPYLS